MAIDAPISPEEQLESLGQAVITTDPDGVVVYWNPAAEQLYGWTAQEALGRNIATLAIPDVAQDVGADIMAALRDGVRGPAGSPYAARTAACSPPW